MEKSVAERATVKQNILDSRTDHSQAKRSEMTKKKKKEKKKKKNKE